MKVQNTLAVQREICGWNNSWPESVNIKNSKTDDIFNMFIASKSLKLSLFYQNSALLNSFKAILPGYLMFLLLQKKCTETGWKK